MTIVTEKMDMNLVDYLNMHQKKFTERELRRMFRMIAEAVDHIHVNGIIHRDIKPENIFVKVGLGKRLMELKIGDFGSACYMDSEKN